MNNISAMQTMKQGVGSWSAGREEVCDFKQVV